MIRKIFLLLVSAVFAFAVEQSFLEPDEAFKTKFEQQNDGVVFKLDLGKDIYLYDDKLKFFISKPEKIDIRTELDIPKPVKYEIWQVQFDNINVKIPYELIQSKTDASNIELTVEYQGCSKAGLCYAPMTATKSIDLSKVSAVEAKKEVEEEQSFLEPHEAFKPSFEKKADSLVFKLDLGKNIYLYDDKLKFSIVKPEKIDIRPDLNIPAPVQYEEWQVQFDNINAVIPYSLIKSKTDASSVEILVEFQGCSKAGLCYAPMSETQTINFDGATGITKSEVSQEQASSEPEAINETDAIANTLKDGSVLLVLATFFGFGLLLSLTPCVFPMIPILSSIIVKAGDSGELTASKGFFLSLIYVLSMAAAYTIAGVLAGLFGANLQVALQNPYVLVVFAGIFVALAFSMFGYFKLELPQGLQNKINKTTDGKEKQGVVGIAIMGFLSALIVGPCVAPPLAGALVYIGQTGDAALGGMALFVMSLGMGVPLLLIGLGAGKFMPKPGGWMDSVSKVFGIVMLAVAVWMLDRVLPAIVVMYLWALLFIGAALYLKVFEHILARLIAVVLMVYGASIFVGALSGATNPLEPFSKFTSGTVIAGQQKAVNFKYVKNLDELDAAIKASRKPVMLDFYADWCVSCKELEGITFKDPAVIAKLQEFTLLKADVTKNNADDKAMQAKFKVVGPPALIFWDENNKEIKSSQIVGYKNPEDFLNIVNKHF